MESLGISIEAEKNKVSYNDLCSHGANCFVFCSACAFTSGRLLPRLILKADGVPVTLGGSYGKDVKNSNFVSTAKLCGNQSNLQTAMKYVLPEEIVQSLKRSKKNCQKVTKREQILLMIISLMVI